MSRYQNQKNWETLMKVLSALALASILLLGASGAIAGERLAAVANSCAQQECTARSNQPLLQLAQSQSPRCNTILQQCRSRCPASGSNRGHCLTQCGEAYENCH
jgi:hypothetical protein